MRPTRLLSVMMMTLLAGCATHSFAVTEDAPAPESETTFTIVPKAAYWIPTLDGHFLVTKASQPGSGTRINVQDDLGVDDASAWSAGFDMLLNDHRFQFSFDRAPFHGSTTVDQSFIYHGAEFEAGTPVSSELTFDLWQAGYDYPLWKDDLVELRLGGRICFVQFATEVGGEQGVEKRSFTQFLPAVDLDLEVTPYPWRVGASAVYGTAGNDRELIDIEAHAGLWLGRSVTLDLGYRWMIVDLTEGTNDADLMLTGPRIALSIRF
jgi:hypothetical protein